MAPSRKYHQIDHTADLGLRVWGWTLPELYANAAEGMCALFFELPAVEPRERRPITAEGHDREELLVDWLGELLYVAEVEQFLPCRFEILELNPRRLRAEIAGEPFAPGRHRWRTGIKAATYHDLEITPAPGGGWSVQIVFDT
jgi:SHS2 domain-containing protein